ncbi:sugar phosphate isomerase/epimerase family protein [Oceanobacillus jeddahense]|uniref:sugar phosphate isomerase/epimerase family protein n=1 Tax=Oceanobacillus jeddahense TaxID=1462527 RepID=UPI0005963D20|nr:TIM barrel protein [Oceanobacillus jeddahense]
MEQQFSLAYLSVINTPPPEMTYMAARAGYDFVSLRPINMGLPNEPDFSLASNKTLLRDTKRALRETGLEVLDIELARVADGIDPMTYEPEFEIAAELGVRHVLSSIWSDDRSYSIEQFAKICDLAKQYNLTVELEYVPIASISNLADTLDILDAAQKDNAGLMIDIHHFHRAQDTIADLSKVPKELFRFVHLCDAPGEIPTDHDELVRIIREGRSYVGEGGIDVAGVINSIPTVPYSIELPNKEQADLLGYEEFARRCLVKAKEYFKKNPRSNQEINMR